MTSIVPNLLAKLRFFISQSKVQFWFLFALIILIRFLPFFQGKTLVYGDNYSLMVPGKIFTVQWLKQGILPLWNKEIFSGLPWIGDVNQSVLYPSTLLFLFFSPAEALNLTVILNLLVAYGGMYLLAKSWLKNNSWALTAAVLWMLSTQITGSINNLSTLQSIVWLPWLSYFGLSLVAKRQDIFWFSLIVLIQFAGGYPQHVLYGIVLAVLLSAFWLWQNSKPDLLAWKKWFLVWCTTGIFTLMISAVIWLPFLPVLFQSTRMTQTVDQSTMGSFQPATLIKLIVPYFFDHPLAGYKWGPAWNVQPNVGLYVTWFGLSALFVSLFLKQKKLKTESYFFAIITLVTLLMALGEHLPFFELVQKIFPLLRVARSPSTLLIITNMVLALWTARSISRWYLSGKTYFWLLILGITVLTLGLGGWWATENHFEFLWRQLDQLVNFSLSSGPFHTLDRDKIIMFGIVKNTVFNSLLFIALLTIFIAKKTHKTIWFIAALISVDLIINTHGQFFFAPGSVYENNIKIEQNLFNKLNNQSIDFQFRTITRNSNHPYTDYGSYWEALVVRAPFSDSFVNKQELETFAHLHNLRDGRTPNWNMVANLPVVNGYTTLLPRDYAQIWQVSSEPRINSLDLIEPSNELLDDWSVRYYLVDSWFKVEEDLNKFPALINFDRWQLLERAEAKPRIRFADDSPATIANFQENPNTMKFVVENPDSQPALLIADRYDKDWQVQVNGQIGTINNFEGMRLIPLETGTNEIILRYAPKAFYFGLGISVFSLTVGTIFLMRREQRV